LPKGGWAAAILARSPRTGKVLFGYFFSKRYEQPPATETLSGFTPSDAILIRMFGDLGLLNGRWKVIGHSENWSRDRWPMPAFVHYDAVSGKPYKREYSDDGENRFAREMPCDDATAKSLPKDGLSGAESLETSLQMALDKHGL
jgi:hypothetical protein